MSAATPKLSNNVLQMKFMQRSVLRIEEEKNAEERQKVIDEEHWVLDLPELKKREEIFIEHQSYGTCEKPLFGRMSFKGFNPEIEKLMKIHSSEQEEKESEKREKVNAVDDVEMTNRYSTLVGIISRKFATKRKFAEQAAVVENKSEGEISSEDDELLVSAVSSNKSRRKFWKPKDA